MHNQIYNPARGVNRTQPKYEIMYRQAGPRRGKGAGGAGPEAQTDLLFVLTPEMHKLQAARNVPTARPGVGPREAQTQQSLGNKKTPPSKARPTRGPGAGAEGEEGDQGKREKATLDAGPLLC